MRIRTGMWGLVSAGILLWVASWVTSTPLVAQAGDDIIGDVRAQLAQNGFSAAESQLRTYKAQHGVTPEYLEALSRMARGAAANKQWDQAMTYAGETRVLSEQQLTEQPAHQLTTTKRKLDADPHLPIALGAAYEVLAQGLAEKGQPAKAVSLLRSALARYGNTSIRARLQKDLNLLTLVGQPAPPLQVTQYLGPKPPALASLKGSPVLLFFWAHWCGDCKAEVPIIARGKSSVRKVWSSSGRHNSTATPPKELMPRPSRSGHISNPSAHAITPACRTCPCP